MRFSIDLGGMYEPPGAYLDVAETVEAAGFDAVWFGDHIQPWFHTDGRAPFAWSWLGAALERTEDIPVGVFVTPPLYRYHPLVVANAAATLDEMYPGRFRIGVGTGEALNEHPFVDKWPPWKERATRLVEAIEIIRTYWTEDGFFEWDGEHFAFDAIYPYEQPESDLDIAVSATGPKSATLAADHGDHLITIASVDDVESRVIDTYRENGGDGEIIVQTIGGYGNRERITDRVMDSFASTLLPENFDETDTRALQRSTDRVSREAVQDAFLITEEPEDVLEWIDRQRDRGADHVVVTDVSFDQERFYRVASERLLPTL